MAATPGPLMIDGGTVDTVEFQGRKLVVLSNERVDTGAGILNGPIMPLPVLLLDLFGTPAVFKLNTPDKYDPETGECTCTHREIRTNVYPESLTMEGDDSTGQEAAVITKLYVPGQAFGYASVALLILKCEDRGTKPNFLGPP